MAVFKVNLFGTPLCWQDREQVSIQRRKGMAILSYLAVLGQPTSRESLATLFWPEKGYSGALQSLRRELGRLKQDIGQNVIVADRKTIVFKPDSDSLVDVTQFEALMNLVLAHDHLPEELCPVCSKALNTAVSLYSADFMDGFNLPDCRDFDEWQYFRREGLRQKLASGLKTLLKWHTAQREYEQAIIYGRRWLSLDLLHEPAHRALMRLYAQTGHYAAAVRQYHLCSQNLQTELAVEPEEETKALLVAVQTKQIAPPASPETAEMIEVEAKKSPARPHNIPAFPGSFVGRREQIKEIQHNLTQTDCRLLTVRGMGGIGKTRLAIQAVTGLIESSSFRDGLFFINLAGVENADDLMPTIAEALRFPLAQATDPLEQLINYLRDKELLLYLDNFEHLQSKTAQLSTVLLQCPRLKLLVTSRHQLNLAGEYVLVLDGLPLPRKRQENSSAIRLFQERARQITPEFDAQAEQPFIHAICHLVAGMPLAIEMCAAWVQTLNCQEILTEIQQGLDLLEAHNVDAPVRHLSIRAVFQSSFNLLSTAEQQALLKLSIFRSGFSRAAGQHVAGATVGHLRSLVEKSLLSVYQNQADTRYHMHPLLNQFAQETLETERLREAEHRHAHYFANLLAQQSDKRCTPENEEIVPIVSVEKENLRYAWHWIGRQITSGRDPEPLCRLVEQILPIWGYVYLCDTQFLDAKQLLNNVWQAMVEAQWETAGTPQQQTTLARVAAVLARFHMELSQYDQAIRLSKEALSILQAQSDSHEQSGKPYLSDILYTWARADIRLGNFAEAEQRLGESLRLASDDIRKADALHALGNLFSIKGEYHSALHYYEEALPLFEQCFEQRRALNCLLSIGTVYGRQRQFEEAMNYFEQVIPLARQTEQKVALMATLSNLAFCLKQVGNTRRVRAYFEEALAIATELGKQRWQSVIAQDFGVYLLEQGDSGQAAQHVQEGLRLALLLKSQPDILAGLLAFVQWQAQSGHFDQALLVAGYVMADNVATEETRTYATDFWEELSSELPAIFTHRAETRLKTATLDDILAQISL